MPFCIEVWLLKSAGDGNIERDRQSDVGERKKGMNERGMVGEKWEWRECEERRAWILESDTLKEAEIGVCASKPKGLRRGSSSEAVLYSPPDSPTMKSLFKPKPRTPSDIVKQTRDLLLRLTSRDDDNMPDLTKNLRDLKSILYGNSESEPVPEACEQLTQEFFADNTLRLLIQYLPKLNLEAIH